MVGATPTLSQLVMELDELFRANYGEPFPFKDTFGIDLDDLLKVFVGDVDVFRDGNGLFPNTPRYSQPETDRTSYPRILSITRCPVVTGQQCHTHSTSEQM